MAVMNRELGSRAVRNRAARNMTERTRDIKKQGNMEQGGQ